MSKRIVSLALLAGATLFAGCAGHPSQPTPPTPGALAIGAVQGPGPRSPREGDTVTVEGVVSARFPGLHGWFLEDAGDGDPASSDGLFISSAVAAEPGQRLRVTGLVRELQGRGEDALTTLQATTVEPLGFARLAPPVRVEAAPAATMDWERLEGMRVHVAVPLTVAGSHELARYGELVASFDGRPYTPTEIAVPGAAASQVDADNARRRLVLDDGRDLRDAGPPAYLGGGEVPRSGSIVTGASGVLDQFHGRYRLQLTEPVRFDPAPRPPAPRVPGDLRIASLNLENLFNGDGHGGGFPTPRGARSEADWQAQQAKLVATLQALDADIAALMELENDGSGAGSSLAQLVAALGGDWRGIDSGERLGTDQIRVALLYRASRVRPLGAPATLGDGPFAGHSRPPLAQAFEPVRAGQADGPAFVVVANHFKSKGCGGARGQDADQGDGQACFNALRTDSARRLDAWLKTDPTGTDSDLAMIVGDLNAYAAEDPIRWLRQAGWRDAFANAASQPYSYVYDGQSGRLDHALLSPALAARLAGAAEWHSNADEPASSGYRAGGAGPWGSSDHDPMLLGFRLRDGVPDR